MPKFEASQVFGDPQAVALGDAVAQGDSFEIARLAAAGVDLAAQGDRGVTLLQWALLNQRKESLLALLEAGADPAQPGIDRSTAVHMAAMADDPDYLQLLLAQGADPDTPHGETRATPLMAALMGEREAQFRMLLAAGADPNRADRMGNTALHVAAKINEPGHALLLIEAGADPHARNAQDASFQRYLFLVPDGLLNDTTRRQRAALVQWLRDNDCVVETETSGGDHP